MVAVIPTAWRLRQEYPEFKARADRWWVLVSKKQEQNHKANYLFYLDLSSQAQMNNSFLKGHY